MKTKPRSITQIVKLGIVAGIAILMASAEAEAQATSVYTDLSDTKCRTLEMTDEEGGSYKGECKGVGGYKLLVIEGDLRQTVTIIDPKGSEHALEYWNFFGGFSSLGDKAEWRLKNGKPIALIVRLNVAESPDDMYKRTSYLVVAKITADGACVTDTLKPTRSQNMEARRIADHSATRPCKSR